MVREFIEAFNETAESLAEAGYSYKVGIHIDALLVLCDRLEFDEADLYLIRGGERIAHIDTNNFKGEFWFFDGEDRYHHIERSAVWDYKCKKGLK